MRILIADDEKPARDRLRMLLDDYGDHEVVAEAANGEEVISIAGDIELDIVLLDIRMPGLTGIEAAQHLATMDKPPAVVFTTAYDEYAIEAFEASAVGYVLKPVRRERLARALEQATRLASNTLHRIAEKASIPTQRKHVCAQAQGELRLIPIDAVYFFQADQKYVCVCHERGEDLIDESLKSLEQEFADRLVRIHRNALVAVDKIESVQKGGDGKHRIILRNDSPNDDKDLIISRRHLADVRRRLKGDQ